MLVVLDFPKKHFYSKTNTKLKIQDEKKMIRRIGSTLHAVGGLIIEVRQA